mmetsp:Transcript_7261/g.19003  ORF Transcript_7261/g.19003 Transcript_7261/m.19003 type:complete len:326 (+) Transcript_7261:58-1035(+)
MHAATPAPASSAAAATPVASTPLWFTPTQKAALKEAQSIWEGVGGVLDQYGDVMLARTLTVHDWNVKSAKCRAQLESTARWRNESGAAAVRTRLREEQVTVARTPHALKVLQSAALLPALHAAKDHDLMSYAHVGGFDVEKFVSDLADDDWELFNLWMLERGQLRVDALSIAQGRLARIKIVQDCEGIGMNVLDRRLLRRLKRTAPLQDKYYPYLTSGQIVVNAPWFVEGVWNMIKGLLSSELRAQVNIVGKAGSAAFLQTVAEASELPNFFGGERTAPPPLTRSILGFDALETGERDNLLTSEKARKYREWVLGPAISATGVSA